MIKSLMLIGIYRYGMYNSIDQIVINVSGIFIWKLKSTPTISHYEYKLLILQLFDLITLILSDIQFMHDTIIGPEYNLVSIFKEPHFLY